MGCSASPGTLKDTTSSYRPRLRSQCCCVWEHNCPQLHQWRGNTSLSLVLGVDKMAPEHTQVTGRRFLSSGRGAWRPARVSVGEQWLNRRMGLAESPPTWAEGSGWMRTEPWCGSGKEAGSCPVVCLGFSNCAARTKRSCSASLLRVETGR